MEKSNFLRLQRIAVDGLFGTYNHEITLSLDDRVTLLHGPNGVGKTVVLQMTNALLGQRFDYFRNIPFSRFSIHFQDDSSLELEATARAKARNLRYMLTLHKSNKKARSARISALPGAHGIAAQRPYLRPHEEFSDTWIDMRDGELLSADEVISRYSDVAKMRAKKAQDTPSWFTEFVENTRAHLIEEQRLVRWGSRPRARDSAWELREWNVMKSTIVEYSRDFHEKLAGTMAEYGRQSQALDQSFPRRLMSAEDELEVPELQNRMVELDQKTTEYKKIGILDTTPKHLFPESSLENIDRTRARVMTLYVQDTESKLQALDDLATRTRILIDNLNRKYRHKKIQVDREQGFVATSDGGQSLPLRSLSSGEQQEFVLHYDLLFRVPSNTIVLIDEPELSLHVAWQKKFLPDLLEIVKLSDFDAVVATHSPFIVGDRTDLMVGLGEAD